MSYAKNSTKKEKGLVKGALRRVFSRSETRARVIDAVALPGHSDPNRPRVTKWCRCSECKEPTPKYLMQVDHIDPVQPLGKALEDMTLNELGDRLWCDESNLQAVCKPCHTKKSKAENAERRRIKKGKSK